MNVTERVTIASKFHLLSRNSLMLVKQTSDRKVYTTNYNSKIYLDIYINYLHLLKFFPADKYLF